jgi:hypothetical protein
MDHAPPVVEERTIDLGLRAAAELPAGEIERGTNASDLTYGALPIALDLGLRLSPLVTVALYGSVAPTIPKLCATTSDCENSVGRDFELAALARFALPRVRFVMPFAEVGPGYFWSARVLESSGVSSTRSFEGPLVRLAIVPTVALSKRFTLGIVLGARLGIAHRVGLEAPAISEDRGPDGARVSAALDVGARLGTSF